MLKKIIFLIIMFGIFGYGFSIDQTQIDYLTNLGISSTIISEILNKKQVSRYDATRVLSYALCYDCMLPPKNIKDKYNFGWFDNFRKQPNFYLNDIDPQDPYYYCVVGLAEKDYIHGYPLDNSVCGGQFCGSNNLTLVELYQIVLNIISPRILFHYQIKNPKDFYDKLLSIKGTDKQKNMNILFSDYEIAKKIYSYGNSSYTLKNFNEFFLYQKYCNLFPLDCDFSTFGKYSSGDYYLSLLNILYNENLLTLQDILDFNPYKVVDGEILIDWLYKVKKINNCKINNDYDNDGISNNVDDCPYTYNPNQSDIDHDGIGDVCDYDIDGDSVKNPLYAVDDEGNINWEAINQWKKEGKQVDNCLLTYNPDQKDTNHNGVGDACENQNNSNLALGVEMNCVPLVGNKPLDVTCKAITKGNVQSLLWFYDAKLIGSGQNLNYTFLTPGNKEIKVIAIDKNGNQATATSFVQVVDLPTSLDVGFSISANPLIGQVGQGITFFPTIKGEIDKIKWNFGDGSVYLKNPQDKPIKKYAKPGVYTVKAYALKNGKIVGISFITIKIVNNLNLNIYGAVLKSDPLIGSIGQNIDFIIEKEGFSENDVSKVDWDFGDGKKEETKGLQTDYKYMNGGTYEVKAVIYLKDGTKIPVSLTQKILGEGPYGAVLKSDPLKSDIGESVDFKIEPEGFFQEDVSSVTWIYGDGSVKVNASLKSNHVYSMGGSYKVKVFVSLLNGQIIPVTLTQMVIGENICSNLNKAKQQLHCDMDEDGIPDMCDSDIDGDGIPNLLGIIKFETPNCDYTLENIDVSRLKTEYSLSKNGQNVDNCPFYKNPNQIDVNENGVGDVCEQLLKLPKDSDWDGISDDKDMCPNLPETYNGYQDSDGCPDVIENKLNLNSPILKVDNCNTCPCQFADYADPFMYGLQIQAALINPFKINDIYLFSTPQVIK